jgi:coenzyme Q-binding protein COQ10
MKHIERRILSHTPKNLFKLVSDVKKYPEFLPWCLGARVNNCTETELNADFSQILLDHKKQKITVNYKEGPFEYLNNYWIFNENKKGCEVEFMVEFKFKSNFLQSLIETLFTEAVMRMVRAFESRANELYK